MTTDAELTGRAPRRRSPWPRRLVVFVVVLAVLLVVLDRGGDYVAERLTAQHLQSAEHLASRPDVSIDGVPFLTQFARRDFDHITVDVNDLPVAAGAVQISHLHVDLNQLTVSRDFASFHVVSTTGRALIDYADLSRRLGIDVRYAGNNRIRASKSFDLPVVGTISPTITLRPALVNGALTFGASSINGAGENVGVVSAALNKIFDVRIPLDRVPFQLRIRSLTVGAQGLQARFVGADLTITKAR
jgi:LmeA-like phospholipid-binding